MDVAVNGGVVTSYPFADTGGWTSWASAGVALNLLSGNNNIRLTASGSAGGEAILMISQPIWTAPGVRSHRHYIFPLVLDESSCYQYGIQYQGGTKHDSGTFRGDASVYQ